MLYAEKAEQFRQVAEYCYENGMFESAANRYYYCLFIFAKGVLLQNNFDYKRFKQSSANLNKQQRGHKNFSHTTIHIALAEHKNFDVEQFRVMWNTIYEFRISADYGDEPITQNNIDDCREDFYSIYRRIRNGRV